MEYTLLEGPEAEKFIDKLDSAMRAMFYAHGYAFDGNVLEVMRWCPYPIKVAGGIMVKTELGGDWMTDIDVFCSDEV